jgi:hypothetical protein
MDENIPFLAAHSRLDTEKSFLGKLHTLLMRGDIAYKNYRSHGKIFLYAKIIKDNNERIRLLTLDCNHLLPKEQQANAMELVEHIDVWSVLWEDLFDRLSPGPFDGFEFENYATFPKAAANSLIAYCLGD